MHFFIPPIFVFARLAVAKRILDLFARPFCAVWCPPPLGARLKSYHVSQDAPSLSRHAPCAKDLSLSGNVQHTRFLSRPYTEHCL